MTGVGQGVMLSVIGLSITFSALFILILLIHFLKRLFPAETASPASLAKKTKQSRERSRDQIRKHAAAAAVATLLPQDQKRDSTLGCLLETGPGNWWKTGLNRMVQKEDR